MVKGQTEIGTVAYMNGNRRRNISKLRGLLE